MSEETKSTESIEQDPSEWICFNDVEPRENKLIDYPPSFPGASIKRMIYKPSLPWLDGDLWRPVIISADVCFPERVAVIRVYPKNI